ncbi:gamma subclass chorismate mutase AroQ, partial [Streptomyces sp. 150FB]|uniref:gamma subclass chorismate mutase AroQ n=1 Tax=Streptomyces sp. 150FB TaxID=1576605 RepID=UPI0006991A76
LAVADRVAAAKRGTDKPVQDPAREREVLASAAAPARRLGADPAATVRVFRDQIEAGKDVQRALLSRWRGHPDEAPAARPALASVRDEINRVDGALVRALARSAGTRTAPVCGGALAASAVRVAADARFDATHRAALHRSLRSVCGPSSASGLRPRPVPEG